MSTDQIVFFDLPSRTPCKTWSLNPWKTRFMLNFKGLDYRTEWTEYPDIAGKIKDHVEPDPSTWGYTIPTVKFPDGTYVMDSRKIATEIEKRYPTPSARLDSPELAKMETIIPKLGPSLAGVYVPLVPVRLLNEVAHPHWYRTREAKFGMPLNQLQKEKGGQKAWDNAKPYLDEITEMLKKNDSGPFFLGDQVSYVDFQWGGFLIFFQRIGADVYQELLKTIGEDAVLHNKLLLALDQWSVRSDH